MVLKDDDSSAPDLVPPPAPKRRRAKAQKLAPPPPALDLGDDDESDDDQDEAVAAARSPRRRSVTAPRGPRIEIVEPVLVGSGPPRLVMDDDDDRDDDDDDHDGDEDDGDDAPQRPTALARMTPAQGVAKRARRRPRVEHISTPPQLVDDDDDGGGDDADVDGGAGARRGGGGAGGGGGGGNKSAAAKEAAKRAKKAAAKLKKKQTGAERFAHLPLEITGIVIFALGVLALLALLSYSSTDTAAGRTAPVHNWIGPGGAVLADLLTLILGVAAFAVPLAFFFAAVVCFRPVKQPRHAALRVAGAVAAALSTMALLHLAFRHSTTMPFPAGGLVGALIADAASRVVAPLGTGIISVALTFVGGLIALDRPVGPTTRGFAEKIVELCYAGKEKLEIWREERRLLVEEEERLRKEIERELDRDPTLAPSERKRRVKDEAEKRAKKRLREISVAPVGPSLPPASTSAPPTALPGGRNAPVVPVVPIIAANAANAASAGSAAADEVATSSRPPEVTAPPTVVEDPPWTLDEPDVDGKVISLASVLSARDAAKGLRKEPVVDASDLPADTGAGSGDDDGELKIHERLHVDPAALEAAADAVALPEEEAVVAPKEKPPFLLPPLNLLDYDAPPNEPLDEQKMRTQADKLIAKFKDFGIEGRIREIRPGPVCTTYELVPAPGIKVSKIAALADDIAMAMEAIHVRIVAPIPGKGAVGIEIPNEKRETVYMKEIIADPAFGKRPDKLMMALGKDIEGRSYYANLADMPHVLIAGTTGSGKSVSVNAMICSILYRATPEDVRFLMIDPKMLELSIYEGIPHLLLPPIIDSKKAALALKWAVSEMERRYQLMSELGVRDLAGFNERVLAAQEGRDPEAKETLTRCLEGKPIEKLPFIVCVVDEYADLLAVAGKDVESYVMRLAQKARAAGLHVMLATQRPSVDVITGVIKANFPVRMGFRLASSHDSKTIINRPGAEKLLGRGDMLFMPPGTSNVLRVHGAFISEKELHRVVEHLKSQGKPTYDMSILTVSADDEGGEGVELDEPKDARYDEAVAVVARTRKCSTSWLQRMMNLGYQRAARIVDRMEREGLVGPAQNAKGDREIYVKPEQAGG